MSHPLFRFALFFPPPTHHCFPQHASLTDLTQSPFLAASSSLDVTRRTFRHCFVIPTRVPFLRDKISTEVACTLRKEIPRSQVRASLKTPLGKVEGAFGSHSALTPGSFLRHPHSDLKSQGKEFSQTSVDMGESATKGQNPCPKDDPFSNSFGHELGGKLKESPH